MLQTGCINCGSADLYRVRSYRTGTKHGKRIFDQAAICECRQCALVQIIPRPSQEVMRHYYEAQYRDSGYAGSNVANIAQFPRDNLFYYNRGESITELLTSYISVKAPRILDIGAGYGHILYSLGMKYPDSARFAIEYSESCVQHLKDQQVQTFARPLEETLKLPEGSFDVVILSHVLEHLLDPLKALRSIHSSMNRGGILYVEVPNIPRESLLQYPDHCWAPRFDEPHITFSSEPTLTGLIESGGFEKKFCATAGPWYKYISALRYRMPPLRSSLEKLMPVALFQFLRRQRFTGPLKIRAREESFYEYGGSRIWIRSIWQKRESGAFL